jgi:CheY-like chemotaxis protein
VAKHKLLLADDSITIQKVVNLTFADEGIEVISVGDGNSALEKLSEFKPDLVMADINMPGLSGYEICERIKQNEETSQIPVILLVGSFEPFDEEEARRVGANDYLTKPFQSIRQLVNKVSALLSSADENSNTDEFVASVSNGEFDSLESISEENIQTQSAPGEQLGDAGMDDEMIQINQGESFAFDETRKFSSKGEFEENYAKTKPLSAEDLDEIRGYQTAFDEAASEESEQFNQNEHSFANQDTKQDFANDESSSANGEVYQPDESKTEEFSQSTDSKPEYQDYQNSPVNSVDDFSDWLLDEVDLLELPPRKVFSKQPANLPLQEAETAPLPEMQDEIQAPVNETRHTEPEAEAESVEAFTESANLEGSDEFTENNEFTENSALEESSSVPSPINLSQGDINAIAQKVIEEISDRVISQLVPQITDLIVKRMAKEGLKE